MSPCGAPAPCSRNDPRAGDCKQALGMWEEAQLKQESPRPQGLGRKGEAGKRDAFVHTFEACKEKQF